MPPIRSVTKTPQGLIIATNTPLGSVTVNPVPDIMTVNQWNTLSIPEINALCDAFLAAKFLPYFFCRIFVVSKSPVTVQVICSDTPVPDGWFTG